MRSGEAQWSGGTGIDVSWSEATTTYYASRGGLPQSCFRINYPIDVSSYLNRGSTRDNHILLGQVST